MRSIPLQIGAKRACRQATSSTGGSTGAATWSTLGAWPQLAPSRDSAARPAAEPRGRGVRPRRDDALPGRDRRRQRDPRRRATSTARRTEDLPRGARALREGRAGRRDHAHRRARGARRARGRRRPRRASTSSRRSSPRPRTPSHYARIVHEMATLRGLIRAGGEIPRLGWERPGETVELVDRAEQIDLRPLAAARHRASSRTSTTLLKESFERITALYEAGADITGTPSGLPRPRPAHVRLPAGQPDHPRGAPVDGEVGARALHGGEPRRAPRASRSGCSRSRCRSPR